MPGLTIKDLRHLVVGIDREIPLFDGSRRRYINLDNAASTPTFKPILEGVNHFLEWYASVHRGTGFKSQLSTWIYEEAHKVVVEFVGADPAERVAIFGKNTTEAVNKLANRLSFQQGDVVVTTLMEHHSNDLPWRKCAKIERIGLDEEGRLDLTELEDKLRRHRGRVRLVAVSGASNVTGIVNPIYDIARLAHTYGAEIFVDAAQLAPHRKIHMGRRGDSHAIDYLALSAHKMYAPFGTGALIGWRETFEQGEPDMVGGGTIDVVTEETVYWTAPPDRDEAGSPNVVGAVALALAIRLLQQVDIEGVEEHETELTYQALMGLSNIDRVQIYGPDDLTDRLGTIAFNVASVPHAKVAAVLNFEGGIGVRNGCFCSHPYVQKLLGVGPGESHGLIEDILHGDRSRHPGAVRISFGVYNTLEEVGEFIKILQKICRGEISGTYVLDKKRGEYWCKGYNPNYRDYFSL